MGVGAVFEADGWYPWLSGRENLMLFAGVRRCDPTVVDELLETVGLTPAAERAVRHYSRGMRQRLAIARARLADPPLLVLDEPTVALDDEAGHWLVHLLVAHVAGGGGVLVASHDAAFLEALGGRVVPVDQGRCR
jgi:ABC-type multidrug transport system ATPase subunit